MILVICDFRMIADVIEDLSPAVKIWVNSSVIKVLGNAYTS